MPFKSLASLFLVAATWQISFAEDHSPDQIALLDGVDAVTAEVVEDKSFFRPKTEDDVRVLATLENALEKGLAEEN